MTITDLLDRHGVDYAAPGSTPHVREGWVGIVCPWCGKGSSNYGLGFNLAKKFWTCWKCGPKKSHEVLTELLGLPDRETRELVRGLTGEDVSRVAREVRTGRYTPPKNLGPMRPVHRKYLKSRGFDPDELEKLWGLQGIGMHPTLAWRVFVPIPLAGEPVSWTTRSVGDHPQRYWSAAPHEEKRHHKHLLYGEDLVKHVVVVHEGPADVWATGPGAVCTFGTNYTRAQVLRVSRFPVRYVCFDAEDRAQAQAKKLCDDLSVFPGETYQITLETGKDSASASEKERKLLRKLLT
jgi:hypothetical protein